MSLLAGSYFSVLSIDFVVIKQVHIDGYKNIADQKLDLSPRINFFVGLNGMGKTNMLDAVHFLCLGRSHRVLPDKQLVKHGMDYFRIHADSESGEKIVAKYQSGKRKVFEVNDAAFSRLSEYLGRYPLVMIAPDDQSLVSEGSEERRRFIDSTLSQVSSEYLGALMGYNQLLKQRNALLKSFVEGARYDPVLLGTYTSQMVGPAELLYEQRRQFIDAFTPVFLDCYRAISGNNEQVAVHYKSELAEVPFEKLQEENADKDRVLGRSSSGPHRDDLNLIMEDLPAKKYASQGQLKSFLLALRLAQYEYLRSEKKESPILLLDDVFDKLDSQRVDQLIGLIIHRSFGQLFITDTHKDRMERIVKAYPGDFKMYEVEDGIFNSI